MQRLLIASSVVAIGMGNSFLVGTLLAEYDEACPKCDVSYWIGSLPHMLSSGYQKWESKREESRSEAETGQREVEREKISTKRSEKGRTQKLKRTPIFSGTCTCVSRVHASRGQTLRQDYDWLTLE